MSWLEVRARFSPIPEDWSPFIDLFDEHGIENTLEDGDELIGAIVEVDAASIAVEELKAALLAAGAVSVQTQVLPEVNWQEAWKQFFKPRRIGQRFVVRPTWEPYELGPNDLEIVLDPGQAFGTGDHPTTRGCLVLLEKVIRPGDTVLDVGCGSGILSVAACRLGATHVVAIDIEPVAVEVARENAAMNDVQLDARAGAGLAELAETEKFRVVVSNIISATLIRLAPEVANVIEPGGDWVVSGILDTNWADVLASAERAGFELVEHIAEESWVAAWLRKNV
ncbi:MAG: 50S ribosomal protein L11 methyltransferase [Fimbriimonas sp.]